MNEENKNETVENVSSNVAQVDTQTTSVTPEVVSEPVVQSVEVKPEIEPVVNQQVQPTPVDTPVTPTVQPVQVTSELPKSQVSTTPTANNSGETPKKEGTFKYVLAFIFLFGIVGFVLFLPEISEFAKNFRKDTEPTSNLLNDGVLVCKMTKSTDSTDVIREFSFQFINKKLITSNFVTTYESVESDYLKKTYDECKVLDSISKNIAGITGSCSLSNGILKVNENFVYKDIDSNNLSQYTEAGGTYPEFTYEQNVYDIQTNIAKRGYDCETKAQSNE